MLSGESIGGYCSVVSKKEIPSYIHKNPWGRETLEKVGFMWSLCNSGCDF